MTWLVLAGVVVAAQAVETTLGFGATVFALAAGSPFVPLRQWVTTLVLVGLGQSVWLVARGFRVVEARLLLTRILPGVIPGLFLGIFASARMDAVAMKAVLGGLVVAVGIWGIAARGSTFRIRRLGAPLLVGGGFFHGLFATGGPLIVAYAAGAIDDKRAFRSTLALLWLALNATLLATWAVRGELAIDAFVRAAALVPALVLGIAVGEWIFRRVPEQVFRAAVHALLVVIGGGMLLWPGR